MLVPTIREGVDFWILQIVLDCFVVFVVFAFDIIDLNLYTKGQ